LPAFASATFELCEVFLIEMTSLLLGKFLEKQKFVCMYLHVSKFLAEVKDALH